MCGVRFVILHCCAPAKYLLPDYRFALRRAAIFSKRSSSIRFTSSARNHQVVVIVACRDDYGRDHADFTSHRQPPHQQNTAPAKPGKNNRADKDAVRYVLGMSRISATQHFSGADKQFRFFQSRTRHGPSLSE